jgi:hypothetical protein
MKIKYYKIELILLIIKLLVKNYGKLHNLNKNNIFISK